MIVQDILVCDVALQLFHRSGVDTLQSWAMYSVSRTGTPEDSGPTCLDLCVCLTCRVAHSHRKGQRYEMSMGSGIYAKTFQLESSVIADGSGQEGFDSRVQTCIEYSIRLLQDMSIYFLLRLRSYRYAGSYNMMH